MSIKSHFITNLKDNLKISYYSLNKKKNSKNLLLFLHGTGFTSNLFFPIINKIHQKFDGCSIAIDFRGHGESETPKDLQIDYSQHTEDVCLVIDDLNKEQVIDEKTNVYGIGFSIGGTIMVDYAIKLAKNEKKQFFKKILLIEPMIKDVENQERSFAFVDTCLRRKNNFKKEEFENFFTKKFFSTWDKSVLEEYKTSTFKKVNLNGEEVFRLRCEPQFEYNNCTASFKFQIWDLLPLIEAEEITLLYGDQSEVFDKEYWERLLSMFPLSKNRHLKSVA